MGLPFLFALWCFLARRLFWSAIGTVMFVGSQVDLVFRGMSSADLIELKPQCVDAAAIPESVDCLRRWACSLGGVVPAWNCQFLIFSLRLPCLPGFSRLNGERAELEMNARGGNGTAGP
jgi:hypothetical protein